MKSLPKSATPGQAGADLAIVQSTLSVVVRCILAVCFLELVLGAGQYAMGLPASLWRTVARGILLPILLLPILFWLVLRPVAQLAARQAAASAEARFEAIAHAAGDAIVILDADWKVHFANRATEKMLGIAAGAWEKTPLEAILPEDTKQFLQAARAEYHETGKPVLSLMGTIELGLLRKDGSRFPAEVRVSEFRDGRQTLFVAMLRDISARKHAEHEIQERTTRLNALLANSPLGMVVLDKDHRVQLCNPAFEELFQYKSAEIAGLELDRLVASEELLEEASKMTKEGMQGRVVHAISQRRRKDGSLVDVEIHAVPLLIGGKLEGAYAIYQDVSERKKLQLYEQLLPVCCMCGKIRDDQGLAPGQGPWDRLDLYISRHSDARLSHTFCPECLAQYRKEQGM
jgi:PAS domain S-box-containing protein